MSGWEVPLVDVEVTEGDVEAVLDCLRSGWLTMGPRTQSFESAIAGVAGTSQAVAVSSGTAALHLACCAAGVSPGDEVIVPSFSFVAAAHAPRHCGAKVVFADSISTSQPNVDPDLVRELIGPHTKAVLAVHFWGYPAAVEKLRQICEEAGVALIEDCAEAIGATTDSGAPVGSVGDIGCFSFFSKKQLAIGEGGAICSDDEDLAAAARSLRSHAMSSVTWERHRGHGLGYDVTEIGFNYRMDEPHAALGLSRIERLESDIEARRSIARGYREMLADVEGVELVFDEEDVARSSHFAFPVLVEGDGSRRDRVRETLQSQGIQTTWYPAIHSLSAYAEDSAGAELPVATEVASRHIILPMHSSLARPQMELVVEKLATALAG